MGFWTAYMGIEGGGTAVVVTVPTVPGAEYRIGQNRPHFQLDSNRTHFRMSDERLHYRAEEETS